MAAARSTGFNLNSQAMDLDDEVPFMDLLGQYSVGAFGEESEGGCGASRFVETGRGAPLATAGRGARRRGAPTVGGRGAGAGTVTATSAGGREALAAAAGGGGPLAAAAVSVPAPSCGSSSVSRSFRPPRPVISIKGTIRALNALGLAACTTLVHGCLRAINCRHCDIHCYWQSGKAGLILNPFKASTYQNVKCSTELDMTVNWILLEADPHIYSTTMTIVDSATTYTFILSLAFPALDKAARTTMLAKGYTRGSIKDKICFVTTGELTDWNDLLTVEMKFGISAMVLPMENVFYANSDDDICLTFHYFSQMMTV
ncbi:unnamed protein product [Miscanthus lutarioriparius]|uniref:Uncharacterized protein n=1 Tax=Miscanthus lutarioriparius TaxID=422564 RepID=A0A811Q964_9POAL|nr:unnamed protein product [Miscanthus lutarioriparius]